MIRMKTILTHAANSIKHAGIGNYHLSKSIFYSIKLPIQTAYLGTTSTQYLCKKYQSMGDKSCYYNSEDDINMVDKNATDRDMLSEAVDKQSKSVYQTLESLKQSGIKTYENFKLSCLYTNSCAMAINNYYQNYKTKKEYYNLKHEDNIELTCNYDDADDVLLINKKPE